MIGEVTVDLMQPKLMSKIVDYGVLGGDMNVVAATGIQMLILVLLGTIAGSSSGAAASVACMSFSNDLRKDVFDKIMHLSFEQTDKFTTGSLVTRLSNDITAVQELVNVLIRMIFRSGVMFIGGIVMTLMINIKFAFILIIILPVQLLIIYTFLNRAAPLFSKVQEKLDKVNSVVQENVSGMRVIKAYVREDYEINRFDAANGDLMSTNLRVQKLLASLMPVMTFIMNAAVIAIIYTGGVNVRAGSMQVGDIMASVTYITMILMSMMMVGMVFQTVTRARASMKRLNEVLYSAPAVAGEDTPDKEEKKGSVVFENVSFSYPQGSGETTLHDINLRINPGETVAILGATGSGKSSLVNLIPRFYDVTEGNVYVDGKNVKDYDPLTLRKKLGVVLQKSELFAGTVSENIRWGKEDASFEEVEQAARFAQAEEFILKFNNKYDTMIEEKGASLSGGQKQRISIARAVIKKPEILILDDSTSALDLSTEARLQKSVRENLPDTTVIMIAQRVASVMRADKIIVLEDGTIAAEGTHDELMKTSGVYRDIYDSQLKKEVV
ncbi:MAG: ABC transporter ATP-binding protein [Oscillospiraceae bacterium]|nr:ABC transporter ATP-binding protein [Oscillospiraceae bacterium]